MEKTLEDVKQMTEEEFLDFVYAREKLAVTDALSGLAIALTFEAIEGKLDWKAEEMITKIGKMIAIIAKENRKTFEEKATKNQGALNKLLETVIS